MTDDSGLPEERFILRASQVRRPDPGPPAVPRPSVTVVPLRESESGIEVLLLRRPLTSRFAPGYWIFPGGVVDPDDHRTQLLVPSPARWAKRLELTEQEAHAYLVAALRETWEETGILLGRHDLSSERLAELRLLVLRGDANFHDVVAEAGVRLNESKLAYFAHWITPIDWPRRYDTRFLLAAVEPEAVPSLVGSELIDLRWMSPAAALQAAEDADLEMLPPTLHTLRRLTGGARAATLLSRARREPVPTYLPERSAHPLGESVVLRVLRTSPPLPDPSDPKETSE